MKGAVDFMPGVPEGQFTTFPSSMVTLIYHGKAPDLLFGGAEPSYDWKSCDTDFYSCTLRNLSNYPIQLREVHAELDKGSLKSSTPKDSSYLTERWGGSLLPPRESLTRRNTWAWGKGEQNTLHKTFRAELLPTRNVTTANAVLEALIEEHGGQAVPLLPRGSRSAYFLGKPPRNRIGLA